MTNLDELSRRARVAFVLLEIGFIGLLTIQLIYIVVRGEPWILWVGRLLPLLIFSPGLFRRAPRSIIWLCFVSLMYFIGGVENLFAMPQSILAWAGMVCVVSVFVAGMLYVRWQSRDQTVL